MTLFYGFAHKCEEISHLRFSLTYDFFALVLTIIAQISFGIFIILMQYELFYFKAYILELHHEIKIMYHIEEKINWANNTSIGIMFA